MQDVCKVAGYEVPAPFPRLTYAQAMRDYGIDKPDLRIPPMHPVQRPVAGSGQCRPAAGGDPHSRAPARLSRKERDELKAFGQERGLRVFDDAKRLERDYPEQMAKVRERCGAKEDRPAGAGRLGRRAEGPASRRDRATRPADSCACTAAQKFNDRHKLLDPKNFQFLWVVDFPMFEWDEEDNRWIAAHHPFTSVHDEDLEKLTADPARCRAKSYDLVLNGTSWARARSVFIAATCRRRSSPRSASATKKRAAASASCWTRWNTARRRTAASRSGSTAW